MSKQTTNLEGGKKILLPEFKCWNVTNWKSTEVNIYIKLMTNSHLSSETRI